MTICSANYFKYTDTIRKSTVKCKGRLKMSDIILIFSSFYVLELLGNALFNPFSRLLVTTVGVTGNVFRHSYCSDQQSGRWFQ